MTDWTNIEASNKVYLDIERAEEATRQLQAGIVNAVYISGAAGVGKTRIVGKAVERFRRKGRDALSIGTAGKWQDLQNALAQSGGSRPVVIDDEESRLFSSVERLNLLKAATGNDGNMHGGIYVKAPVIVSTNADLSPKGFSPRKQAHVPALWGAAGRGVLIDIERDRRELWEYTCYLALRHDLIRVVQGERGRPTNVPLNIAFAALDWFTANSHRLDPLTPRTLENITRNFVHSAGSLLHRNLRSLLADNVIGARMPAQQWQSAWEQANGKPLVTKQEINLSSDRMEAATNQQRIASIIEGVADRATAHG